MPVAEPMGSALARTTLAQLKARISAGEWPVGSRIPTEPELTEQLGVGRSTVREAVRSLATLGMIETLPARGTFVRSLTPAPSLLFDALQTYHPAELIGIRRALDVEAAQTAAAQWVPERLEAMETAVAIEMEAMREHNAGIPGGVTRCTLFHGAIAQASGNRLLADLDTSLSRALDSSGLGAHIAESIDPAILLNEHDRILTSIRSRDVAAAAHLMALHSDAALRTLRHSVLTTEMTALSQQPG